MTRAHRRSPIPLDAWPLLVVLVGVLSMFVDPPKSWIEDTVFGARAAADTSQIAFAAADFHRQHGRWPEAAELLADKTLPSVDPWRHAFRFAVSDGRCHVRSAGIDGCWDTGDDLESQCKPDWRP